MLNKIFSRLSAAAAIALTFVSIFATAQDAPKPKDDSKQADAKSDAPPKIERPPLPDKFGVLLNESRACPGYNLINSGRKETYLYDNEGRVVHTWKSEHNSFAAVYLLENGHLFRPAEAVNRKPGFQGPAAGGRIQEFDWDGNLVWDFEYHSEQRLPHHDAIKLPNGNALLICWERIDEKEAIAQGRRPETMKDSHLQPDCVVEIKQTGPTTGEIVWEWRAWDHLVQERDKTKPNYGNVSEHPELFDVNYIQGEDDQVTKLMATKEGRDKLRSLGYIGSGAATPADAKNETPKKEGTKKESVKPGDSGKQPPKKGADAKAAKPDDAAANPGTGDAAKDLTPIVRKNPDWMHVNAIAYNAELDQIALSSPNFCEIWIIDHSTTTEEARGHKGGRWGKGGDILYRWGNPRTYRNGTAADQKLFYQHNIHWIPRGLPGEGHLLVFNNGGSRKPEEYSSVEEFIPPTDKQGNYVLSDLGTFGPEGPHWIYTAPRKTDFFSWFISGAHRLPNGNTLINSGAVGVVFEVTPEGETVWTFANPFKPNFNPPPGANGPPKRFESINRGHRDALALDDEQKKKLDAIDDAILARLDKILTAEQIQSLGNQNPTDGVEFSKRPAGEYLGVLSRSSLEVSDEKKSELQAVQKEFDPQIAGLLNDKQKSQIVEFKKEQAANSDRPPRPNPGRTLFRASRYPTDHPAFAGRTLTPGRTLVEIEEEQAAQQKAEEEAAKKKAAEEAAKKKAEDEAAKKTE